MVFLAYSELELKLSGNGEKTDTATLPIPETCLSPDRIAKYNVNLKRNSTKGNICRPKQSKPTLTTQTIADKSINLPISQPASHPVN
jgi:hypothetical protein